MKKHFIKKIEIKEFKCFDNFKADGFSRVNLIGGKNNVGKTALMEAIDVNLKATEVEVFSTALMAIKYRRERITDSTSNYLSFLEKSSDLTISSNIRNSSFKITSKDGIKEYFFLMGEKKVSINANDFSLEINNINNIKFMSSLGANNAALIKNYSTLQKNDKEQYLNDFLKKVDSRIDSFKLIGDVPQCKVNSKYIEITDMGEGIRHLINIISSLYSSKDGQLFIDEIDNGLHYTLLDDIWDIIFTLSKELNIQVFATTHSKECIESFVRVIKKLDDTDASYTLLSKLKDGSVDAGVYDTSMLINTLEQDHEIRGW